MTIYQGNRKGRECYVTADDVQLTVPHPAHSDEDIGFEWGYEGRGPDRLALAVLCHHFGSIGLALNHHRIFIDSVVAHLPHETWSLTSKEIKKSLDTTVDVPMTLTELMNKVRGGPAQNQRLS